VTHTETRAQERESDNQDRLGESVQRFTNQTIDLFNGDTHEDRVQAQMVREGIKQRRGGRADTGGLPIFTQNQTDLFVRG